MINLRYHIVSLTAVFLALAIGVLLGGTYLDKYTVDQLDQSISSAEQRIRETRAENDRLRGEIGDATARNQALIGGSTLGLFAGSLTDVPVLVVAAEGADETSRRNLAQVLNASGADFRGTLTITGKIALEADVLASVASRLGIEDPSADDVRSELIDQFGDALSAAGQPAADAEDGSTPSTEVPDPTAVPESTSTPETILPPATAPDPATPPVDPAVPTTTVPPQPPTTPDIVAALIETGIASFEEPPTEPTGGPLLTGSGYRYVFLPGSSPASINDSFLIPVLRRMAESGPVPVLVAVPSTTERGDDPQAVRAQMVTTIRSDAELTRLVSTVDNLNWFNGQVATVLGLQEIGRGSRGHYGEGRGAAAPLPGGT